MKACRKFRPHIIVLLGDFADCGPLSAHARSKIEPSDFAHDVREVRRQLARLESMGADRLIYIMGNHEFRLDRYVADRAPALFNVVNLNELFELDAHGWEVCRYRKTFRLGKLNLTHDTGSAGMNAHRTAAQKHMGSTIIGHTHRFAYEVKGKFDGVPYLAAMFGWLGDAEAADYLHEAQSASDWAHGFGYGYMEEESEVVHVVPVPIIKGQCVLEGELLS